MRRALILAGALVGVAVLVVGGTAIASAKGSKGGHSLTVIEHATTDTVIDLGDPGDSTGDLLTFHNDVYDATDSHVVGTDQGECVRIDPAAGTWECRWITMLDGGQITVEGPFYDTADSTLAVTGGTGGYRNVRGQMSLRALAGGTEFDFTFSLIG